MTHETREGQRGNLILRLLVIVTVSSILFGMLIGMVITTNYLK